jgi:rhamnogalacturonyl hydrolase YesR
VKPSIEQMLTKVITRDPLSINTDWDGSLLITAMLAWEQATGERRYGDFAKSWFEHHKEQDHRLTDEEFYSGYTGIKSKILREGPIPFTAYCGHWGLAYTCPGLSRLTDDPAVAEVADAIASYMLHRASRSAHGCVYHDDDANFVIPDTCYFASPILAIASRLTGKSVYMEQAVHQLHAYTNLFQDKETGLAHTLWSHEGMPRKFWSRASGWFGGALVNTLQYMEPTHPDYNKFADALRELAKGVVQTQREDGGFHLLLDRPDIPVDCTAPSMIALTLRSGVQLGILEPHYDHAAQRAWEATTRFVTAEGQPTQAYTGWAKPAIVDGFGPNNFDKPRDFVIGLILLAAASFETSNSNQGVITA